MSNKMSYEKCKNCYHSYSYYEWTGGLILMCRVTGKSISVNSCPEVNK